MRTLLLVALGAVLAGPASLSAQATPAPEVTLSIYAMTAPETWVKIETATDSPGTGGVQISAPAMSRDSDGVRALAPLRLHIGADAQFKLRIVSENPNAMLKLTSSHDEAMEAEGPTFTIGRDAAGVLMVAGQAMRRFDGRE